jgi:hypothetical protein
MRNIKTKEKKMSKVKLIISIIAAVFLVTQGNSFSQEKEITGTSVQTINQTGNDINPQTGIFKLFGSKQTQFDNTAIIAFQLGEEANVLLTVCDPDGKILETLVDDLMDAGDYSVNFKSADKIVSGQFTYKLEVKGISGIKNVFAVK